MVRPSTRSRALCISCLCFDQRIRFPPCPVVHVPVLEPGQAAVQTKVAMELTAVTCIQRFHHVAFLRLPDRGADGRHRWAFYDSMSDIQKGHRVPILFEVPGLAEYFENGYNASCMPLREDGPSRDPFVDRLQKTGFMSLYTSSPQ